MALIPGASKADAKASTVSDGLLSRIGAAVKFVISGNPATDFFGPGQPLAPVAQDRLGVLGRQFDYMTGRNQQFRPREEEAVTYAQMRALADSYDLLRLIIETRKDQMSTMEWTLKPRDDLGKKPGERSAEMPPDVKALIEKLRFPDGHNDWATWLRMWMEDMMVMDAATIYPRMTNGGDVYALEIVDGATIRRVLDQTGRTPAPPEVAYQQILKGMPAADYHRDELFYLVRNPRSNRVYGLSHVEQIIMTVNIALRRQIAQLQYFTEGTIPDAFVSVPKDWQPDQIKAFQESWDALIEGNTAQRRKAKFIPGESNIHETHQPPLKDQFDEWLARIVCYCFGVESTPFVAQVNRATSQTTREQALSEGKLPMLGYVERCMDRILAFAFKRPDLCFRFDMNEEVEPLTQAQIDKLYVDMKCLAPSEVREKSLNLPPMTPEQLEEVKPAPAVGVDPLTGLPLEPEVDEEGKPVAPGKGKTGTKPGEPPTVAASANPKSQQSNDSTESAKVEKVTHHHHITVEAPEILVAPHIHLPAQEKQ